MQVRGGAPVDLLLGTDLLPHLGFSMVAKNPDGFPRDLLQKPTHSPTTEEHTLTNHAPVVRLIQPTKLPPLHQKMVRAKVHTLVEEKGMMLFEPKVNRDGVQVAEAAIELSEEQEVTLILQNWERTCGVCRRSHPWKC